MKTLSNEAGVVQEESDMTDNISIPREVLERARAFVEYSLNTHGNDVVGAGLTTLNELDRVLTATPVPDGEREAVGHEYTCGDDLIATLPPVVGDGEPVAWKHTMHQEFGQKWSRITTDAKHPFGIAGRNFSSEYSITTEPLYARSTPSQGVVEALEFYADPFAWKKKHDPDDVVRVPDFYSETSFGDTALEAIRALARAKGEDTTSWQPIETAPKDGTRILGRRPYAETFTGKLRHLTLKTFWGKTSHVPLYGWNHGNDVENMNLWEPTRWMPLPEPPKE